MGCLFPKGRTGALVRALVKLFRELGGEIRLESEVAEIDARRNVVGGGGTRTAGTKALTWW